MTNLFGFGQNVPDYGAAQQMGPTPELSPGFGGAAYQPGAFNWDVWTQAVLGGGNDSPMPGLGENAPTQTPAYGNALMAGADSLAGGLAGVAGVNSRQPLPRDIGQQFPGRDPFLSLGDRGLMGLIADASGRGPTTLRR